MIELSSRLQPNASWPLASSSPTLAKVAACPNSFSSGRGAGLRPDRVMERPSRLELSGGLVVGQAERRSALNTDFLAIIDADPRSATYGKVVNTASLAARWRGQPAQRSRVHRPARADHQVQPAGQGHSVERAQRSPSHVARADRGRTAPLSLSGRADQRQRVPLRCRRPAADPYLPPDHDGEGRPELLRHRRFRAAAQRQSARHLHGRQEPHDPGRTGRAAPGRLGRAGIRSGARRAARPATGRASTVSPTPACSPIPTASTSGRTSTSSSRPTTPTRSASRPRRRWTP